MGLWSLGLGGTIPELVADTKSPVVELVDVRKIWDQAAHNAFTDLSYFQGDWYCAFREGEGHVSDDGRLRVLRSADGVSWNSVGRITWPVGDLRDAKLSVTPDGQLMLNSAVRFLKPREGKNHQSATWYQDTNDDWSGPFFGEDGLGTWRWSVTWQGDVAYSFGYSGDDAGGCLYRSHDGKRWETVVDDVYPDVESYGNETSLLFRRDEEAICLLRRDGGSKTALLGRAKPPYTQWTWRDLGVRIGGPKMIAVGEDRLLATVRLYDGRVRTSVCWIDPHQPHLKEALELPSGGDTSYAGMVLHEERVWISYYSSHEGKSAIYLARVRFPD